jgi:hypothetical protein
MANYVLVIDLGEAAAAKHYLALNQLMYEFGFTLRGPETLRPAKFSLTSALPLRGLRQMVEGRVKTELQANVSVDAYEIKQLLPFSTTRSPHRRRFH